MGIVKAVERAEGKRPPRCRFLAPFPEPETLQRGKGRLGAEGDTNRPISEIENAAHWTKLGGTNLNGLGMVDFGAKLV